MAGNRSEVVGAQVQASDHKPHRKAEQTKDIAIPSFYSKSSIKLHKLGEQPSALLGSAWLCLALKIKLRAGQSGLKPRAPQHLT